MILLVLLVLMCWRQILLDFNSSLFDEILDRHEHRGNGYDATLALLKTALRRVLVSMLT